MKARQPKPTTLTDAQLTKLASVLINTQRNVYQTAKSLFKIDVFSTDDKVFADLERVAGIFKCEHCDTWLDIKEERAPDFEQVCHSCLDKLDAED